MASVAQDAHELLTPHEAARLLRVSQSTVYRLLARGSIPAARVGGQWRIDSADLARAFAGRQLRRGGAMTVRVRIPPSSSS